MAMVKLYLSDAQRERLTIEAERAGSSLSEHIRSRLFGDDASSSPAAPDLLSQLDAVKVGFARQLRAHDERLKVLEGKPRSEPEAKRSAPSEPKRQRVSNPQGWTAPRR